MREGISLHQLDRPGRDFAGAERRTRFGQHRGRRIDADKRTDAPKSPKIAPGTAPKIEGVNGVIEATAHAAEPLAELPVRADAAELLVVVPIPARVLRLVEFLRFAAPGRRARHGKSSSAATNLTSAWRAA